MSFVGEHFGTAQLSASNQGYSPVHQQLTIAPGAAPMPPVVLGVDFDAEPSTGIGSARKRKPGWRQRVDQAAALAIGAGVVIVRMAMGEQQADKELAAAAIRERDALQLRVAELEAELLHRPAPGALLIETRPVAAPAKATRPRWTAAQRAFLAAELDRRARRRPGYKAIALLMTDRFNRQFIAAGVGQQARRLRAAPDAPAPPAKPARTRHGGRGRAA